MSNTSMSYNQYDQKDITQSLESKRAKELEDYRNEVATKSALLKWSSSSPITLSLVKPSGNTPSGDTRTDLLPYDQAMNPLTVAAITKAPVNGWAYIPEVPTVKTAVFQFFDNIGTSAGYSSIKYLFDTSQLVEINGEVILTLNSTTTKREIGLSIYKNGTILDSKRSQFSTVGMTAAGDTGIKVSVSLYNTLDKDDLITLMAWRTDGASAVDVDCHEVLLSVRTII